MWHSIAIALAWFLFTCGLLPLAFAGAMLRLARPDREYLPLYAQACAVLAPLAISLLFSFAYLIFPGIPNTVVAGVCLAFGFGLAVFARIETAELVGMARAWCGALLRECIVRPASAVIPATVLVVLAITACIQLSRPLFGSDLLEYFNYASVFALHRDMSVYPLINTELTGGLYFPSSHPPGFPLLILWASLAVPEGNTLSYHLLAVWYCIMFARLLMGAAEALFPKAGLAALILLCSIPTYLLTAYNMEGDIIRLPTFFATFAVAAAIFAASVPRRLTHFLVFGLCAGLTIFAHSISILIFFLLGAALLLLHHRDMAFIARLAGISLPLSLLLGGWQYARNSLRVGSPIHDYVPIWELPFLHWHEILGYARELETLSNRLLNGTFSLFTRLDLYGLTGIAMLIGILLLLFMKTTRGRREFAELRNILCIGAAAYGLLMLGCALLNIQLAIKNYRYIMTIVPLLLPLSAAGLTAGTTTLFARLDKNGVRRITQRQGLCWLIVLCVLFISAAHKNLSQNYCSVANVLAGKERRNIARTALGYYSALNAVENAVGKDGLVLSSLHSFLSFYTKVPNISEFDARLAEAYSAETPDAAQAQLRQLGVTHILRSSWAFPTYYNTRLADLTASPEHTTPVSSCNGMTLFALRSPMDGHQRTATKRVELGKLEFVKEHSSYWWDRLNIVGMVRYAIQYSIHTIRPFIPESLYASAKSALYDVRVWLYGGVFPDSEFDASQPQPAVKQDNPEKNNIIIYTDRHPGQPEEMLLTAEIQGRGNIYVIIYEYYETGSVASSTVHLGTFLGERRVITERILLQNDTVKLMIRFSHINARTAEHTVESAAVTLLR